MITFRSESAYGDNAWDWEFDSVEDIVVEYNKDPRYGSPDLPSDDDCIFDVAIDGVSINLEALVKCQPRFKHLLAFLNVK